MKIADIEKYIEENKFTVTYHEEGEVVLSCDGLIDDLIELAEPQWTLIEDAKLEDGEFYWVSYDEGMRVTVDLCIDKDTKEFLNFMVDDINFVIHLPRPTQPKGETKWVK